MTHPITNPEAIARCEAGRAAVQVCDEYDAETAANILCGRLTAYLIAVAQVSGWDTALAIVDHAYLQANAIHFPQGNA